MAPTGALTLVSTGGRRAPVVQFCHDTKMSSRCHAAVGAVLLAVSPALARADDAQLWTGINARGPVAGRIDLAVESIARSGEGNGGGLYESENSAVLGYRIDGAVLAAGYVRDITYRGGGAAIEQRARQELTINRVAALGSLIVDVRLRTEERWRDGLAGTGVRIRPYVRLTLPVAIGLRLLATHESFVNLGAGAGQRGGYDRARSFLGIGVPLSKRVGAEIGYLHQWTRGTGMVAAAAFTLAVRW